MIPFSGPPATATIHRRILVVDDHEETLRAFTSILERRGFAVTPADSVQSAITAADRSQFDIVISDLDLPDGDGGAVIAAIKSKQLQVRGIALSGHGMAADVRASLDAGFDAHLVKPVTVTAILNAISRLSGSQTRIS